MPEQRPENKKARTFRNENAGVSPNANRPPLKTGPYPNVGERLVKAEEYESPQQQNAFKFLQKWFGRKPA